MSDAEEREGEMGQSERAGAARAGARVDRAKQNVAVIAAMSPVQQGILFHSLGCRQRDPYHCQLVFAIHGALDREALRRSWQLVVDRHPVLRSDYRWEETSSPLQVIFERASVDIPSEDWSMHGADEQRRRLQQRLARAHAAGFDFRHAAELRLELIECARERHWLLWSFHHVVLDGWSVGVVLGEVLQAYEAFGSGAGSPRLERALPYVDYIAWLNHRGPADAVRYWEALLAGLDGPTPLPAARERRETGHSERRLQFDAEESAVLRRAARELGVTLGTLVQGAWAVLLGRHADAAEVVFGVTVSGRSARLPGIEKAVGLFINTLPARVALSPAQSVRDWLAGIQAQNVESGAREHLPPSAIARVAGQRADVPLFDSAVVFNNYPIDAVLRRRHGGLHIEPLPLEAIAEGSATTGRNNYALSLVAELGERIDLVLAFDRSRFGAREIDELGAQLRHVLWALSRSAAEPLGNIGLAAPAQPAPRRGACALEPAGSVVDAFRAVVARAPDALALRAGTSLWSYAGLERASRAVAQQLIAHGVRPEEPVILLGERSGEFVTALLAVLAAGAAYVPVEQGAPPERLREIVRDSGARLLLTTSSLLSEARKHVETALVIEGSSEPVLDAPELPPLHPDRAAYVIYTSGSTGKPKGVVVSHGALALYVRGMAARAGLEPDSSLAMVSTISADLGHTVLFGALCLGARLELIDERATSDPDAFASSMQQHGVEVLKIVPSHLKGLLYAQQRAAVLPSKLLILGGEPSSRSFVQELRQAGPGCRVMNHYGPTETTVGVAMYELASFPEECDSLPIGTALPGAELYALDRELNPVPSGVDAELYIGGARLARGYWASPRLTAERFVPDPHGVDGRRMYRTGDRVRVGRDGNVEFLGRRDRQLKIRGHRVELQEIEQRLLAQDGVREAAVVVRASPSGEGSQLYAYVTGRAGAELPQRLQRELSAVLPKHMVPARFIPLERMPITTNGKLDRRALQARLDDVGPAGDGVEPESPVERALREVWQEVLRVERIGVEDNFFDVGGDSILSLQIVAKARRRGLRMTPKQLFELQTIRRLAVALTQPEPAPERPVPEPPAPSPPEPPSAQAIEPAEHVLGSLRASAESIQRILPVSSVQHGMLLHSVHGRGHGVYISQLRARVSGLDVARFEAAWRRVEERHEALRSSFVEREGAGYVQVIRASAPTPIERVDWSRRERPDDGLEELATRERARGFELDAAPLQRLVLVELSGSEHDLIWTHHHALLDGWSRARLIHEVLSAYQGKALPPAGSYAEHAKRASAWDERAAEAFWKSQLRALDDPTLLARALRPSTLGAGYGQLDERLSGEQTREIARFAQRQRVTLNTVLQGAWLTSSPSR